MPDPFFHVLNYSAAHEDSQSELAALAIAPEDRVACISGSGARVLEILLGNPREVVAIDVNPAQLALLELTIAAMRVLSHAEFLAFIGVTADGERMAVFRQVRAHLAEPARQFWDRHLALVAKGVIYSGQWERKLRIFSRAFTFFRRRMKDRLFAITSLEEQARFWNQHWDDRCWRAFLKLIFNRTLWHRLGNEPGAFLVSPQTDVPAYFRQRFAQAAATQLFHQSAWAWLVFYGRYNPTQALPLYLQPDNYHLISSRLDRIRPVNGTLTSCLENMAPGTINAFSISDVSSYLTEAEHEQCWRALRKSAAPGARVCERRFLVRYPNQWAADNGFRRNLALEQDLGRRDQSIVYDFFCGSFAAP